MRWEAVIGARGSGRRFVLSYGAWISAFEFLFLAVIVGDSAFVSYLEWNASWSTELLRALGVDAVADGSAIVSGSNRVEVTLGCDAVQPTLLFAAAVLSFARSLPSKLRALALGAAIISSINLLRIASLVVVSGAFPDAFDLVHFAVWPLVFGLVILVMWTQWALRSSPRK